MPIAPILLFRFIKDMTIIDDFFSFRIDGKLLLKIDDSFLLSTMKIAHTLKRRRVLKYLDILKKKHANYLQVILKCSCFIISFMGLFIG